MLFIYQFSVGFLLLLSHLFKILVYGKTRFSRLKKSPVWQVLASSYRDLTGNRGFLYSNPVVL